MLKFCSLEFGLISRRSGAKSVQIWASLPNSCL